MGLALSRALGAKPTQFNFEGLPDDVKSIIATQLSPVARQTLTPRWEFAARRIQRAFRRAGGVFFGLNRSSAYRQSLVRPGRYLYQDPGYHWSAF